MSEKVVQSFWKATLVVTERTDRIFEYELRPTAAGLATGWTAEEFWEKMDCGGLEKEPQGVGYWALLDVNGTAVAFLQQGHEVDSYYEEILDEVDREAGIVVDES